MKTEEVNLFKEMTEEEFIRLAGRLAEPIIKELEKTSQSGPCIEKLQRLWKKNK